MTIMRSPEETEADAEDREYVAVDLSLPADQRCGHVGQIIVGVTRTCSRRASHVNDRHRDGEISWTNAMPRRHAPSAVR